MPQLVIASILQSNLREMMMEWNDMTQGDDWMVEIEKDSEAEVFTFNSLSRPLLLFILDSFYSIQSV